MAIRNRVVPEPFIVALRRQLPGFANEAGDVQQKLAFFALHADRRRRHSSREGYLSISYQELEKKFGRGQFVAINQRLNLFEVTAWSQDKGETRGFRLTEYAAQIRAQYFGRQERKPAELIANDGKKLRTLPRPIASQDKKGVTVRGWPNSPGLSCVEVDLDSLKRLRRQLTAGVSDITTDMFSEGSGEQLTHAIDALEVLLKLSNTVPGGRGRIPHFYEEAASGRLYAIGTSLQSVPTRIKEAALNGKPEYDFENCHYAIFQQMAARYGYACPRITDYLARKNVVRNELAQAVGVSVGQIKECLLALMYGARSGAREANAIPQIIADRSKVAALQRNPLYAGIAGEIKKGRDAVIGGWARVRDTIKNDAGKTIPASAGRLKIQAHLLQGAEAAMLRVALTLYPDEIVLCQHDGFVASKLLDRALIEREIYSRTGYQMVLAEHILQVGENLISKTPKCRIPLLEKDFYDISPANL